MQNIDPDTDPTVESDAAIHMDTTDVTILDAGLAPEQVWFLCIWRVQLYVVPYF
jgi:hypothetical protein